MGWLRTLFIILLAPSQAGHSYSSAVLTTKTSTGPEVLLIPFRNNCTELRNFGRCEVMKRMVPSWRETPKNELPNIASMLHSVTFDNGSNALCLTELPGSSPPLKLNVASVPPKNDLSTCRCFPIPPKFPEKWSAKVMLTPFTDSALVVGTAEYSSSHNAMHFRLYHPTKGVSEIYVHKTQTYHLRSLHGKKVCEGPYDLGWMVPSRDWLQNRPCKCQGSFDVSGVDTVFWGCPVFNFVEWFWFYRKSSKLWRIMLNNKTNPSHLPVLGEYAMTHFTSYGDDVHLLVKAAKLCKDALTENFKPSTDAKSFLQTNFEKQVEADDEMVSISGFSYNACKYVTKKGLPKWPEHFYLTVTMVPVNDANPFPTQVVYDWSRESQHTRMYSNHAIYDSYLISDDTYILTRFLDGRINCTSHLKFGPPRPNWMNEDKCKCMGRIHDNPDFSPWHNTTIAVCPLIGDRVFWTWFSDDHAADNAGYTPVMFYETSAPLGEGTNLALADYHYFSSKHLLIDLSQFKVPPKCLKARRLAIVLKPHAR